MKLKKLDGYNAVLENTVYYTIHLWKNVHDWGETYPIAYLKRGNADRIAEKLWDTGNFECITVRREDVVRRNPKCEISTSSVVKHYRTGKPEEWAR